MHHDPVYNQSLIDSIKLLIGTVDVAQYFSDAIVIKKSPHTELFRCYGCVVTNDGLLKLMDVEEQWHEVEVDQDNVGYILASLQQRLKTIAMQKNFA